MARIIQEMPSGDWALEHYCDRLISKSKIFMKNFYRDQDALLGSEVHLRKRKAMFEDNLQGVYIRLLQPRPLSDAHFRRFYSIYLINEKFLESARGEYECSSIKRGAKVVFTQNSSKVTFLYFVRNDDHHLTSVTLKSIE